MDWKPFSVVFFCSFCAAASGAMAADRAGAPGVAQADSLPMAMMASVDEPAGTLTLSSFALDLSPGSIALSVDERLQLREEIRKAARDIYAETEESAARRDMSQVPGARVTVSP